MSKLSVADLFSGIGGFSFGLESTGKFNTEVFCEKEVHCRLVLKKHWPTVPIHLDVNKLQIADLEGIAVFTGGFPCQDISIANTKGKGLSGKRSGLWFQYKRLINEWRPKYAIIENVSALRGRGLNQILSDLAEIGYDATWTMFDTKYFGLPQRRRRVYILAVRDGIPAGADILQFGERDTEHLRRKMATVERGFEWNFTESRGVGEAFAYFTRQRSDEFACSGVSGTLAKRDYKSYTDIVYQDGVLRRVTPQERMLLQGFPSDWLEGVRLTEEEMFTCNGMSVPVVSYLGERLYAFDQEYT